MQLRYKILLLVLPFAIMVIVNEWVRPNIAGEPYDRNGISAINSLNWKKTECSWACHNDSAFCEKNHIKYMQPIKSYIDPIYFGMIRLMKATGNYGLANIIFLATVWPLLMWYLLIKVIEQRRILKALRCKK